MLTTRSDNGQLHSRAMNPSKREWAHHPYRHQLPSPSHIQSGTTDTQLNLVFVANNVSHKFDEIQNDSHVNVSFYDPASSNWAS